MNTSLTSVILQMTLEIVFLGIAALVWGMVVRFVIWPIIREWTNDYRNDR